MADEAKTNFDVIVVGGGPGGYPAAPTLEELAEEINELQEHLYGRYGAVAAGWWTRSALLLNIFEAWAVSCGLALRR